MYDGGVSMCMMGGVIVYDGGVSMCMMGVCQCV